MYSSLEEAFELCKISFVTKIDQKKPSLRTQTYFRLSSFSHDVMAAIFVSQNNETAAMFVSQTSPLGAELFSYVNAFFCSNKVA